MDLTFHRSSEGSTFGILGVIDQGSRKVLCLKAVPTKCAFALLGHLFIAFSRFGLPTAIRTDNEGMFVSKLWSATLRALAIAHRRGPPAQPWRNGRIERLFGTLKPLLRDANVRRHATLWAALHEFTLFYNVVRPHQALGGLTPDEVWQGRSLADVQSAHGGRAGQWVHALGGLLVGYHLRR
jgi:transposase InsO family protein